VAEFVLAIDLGTTGVKAVVFDAKAEPRGRAVRQVATVYPHPGWVEQPPTSIWQSVREANAQALANAGIQPCDLAAVGVTNQRSSIVAWDENLRELSAMINWQDTRSARRCAELGEQGFFISPMMAASKAEWIVAKLPAVAEAAERGTLRLGTPDSWLVARLTGALHVTDHSNASSTGLYAHFDSCWDASLLEALGIEAAWMPSFVESSGRVGMTSKEALGAEVPISAICADQQASLFGLGCHTQGASKISYGTSASVNMHSGDGVAMGGAGTFPLVAWRIGDECSYCVEGQVVTAGAAVQWLKDGLRIVDDAAETSSLAERARADSGVWAVPAFQGLGTPEVRPEARAILGGLTRGSGRNEIVRALLEGVAHRVTDAGEAVWLAAAAPPDHLRADGAAAANDFLLQSQADLLGVPIERSPVLEGAALGAALLAGVGVGIWSSIDEVERLWHPQRVFEAVISEDERAERKSAWRRRLDKIVAAEL